ncbi:MAG: S8 family serine peptidase [Planctomycetota bacterium]
MLTRKMTVVTIVLVLACWIGSAQSLHLEAKVNPVNPADSDTLSGTERLPAAPPYKPGEIIVKFKQAVAERLEQQLTEGRLVEDLELSPSLQKLSRKHKVKTIRPVFKDFKGKRQRMKVILKKDKALLSGKEKRLLRRLKRAPVGAKVPDLGRLHIIELEEGRPAARAMAAYSQNADVEYAELNYVVSILSTEPNDPNFFPEQWALCNDGNDHPFERDPDDPNKGRFGGPAGTPDCDIDATEAWDIQTGSKDVTVAVLDTGVYYGHADLANNMWTNTAEYNGEPNVDDDDNGYVDDIYGYDFCTYRWPPTRDSDPNDDNGHGTHCAGIIAADGNNDIHVAGICWDANIMALKFLSGGGRGVVSDAIDAIYYGVENGADIISNSWGGVVYSQSLKETFDYAYSEGVYLVAAAGNDDHSWPLYPAYHDKVMSVSATDHNDIKTSFSSFGYWVDVAAPGQDILSLRVPGKYSPEKWYPYNDPNAKLCVLSGTSMACPHVAGLAGLCLAEDPSLSVQDLWVLIKNGCDDIDANDPNADYYYGSGRINAYNTVNYISSIPTPDKAADPYPDPHSTTISVNVHLSWEAASWATSHDVYFGTNFNDVNDANTSSDPFEGNQEGRVFDPNTLDAITTYYWRIDEKNSSGTTKGDVWDFSTGPDSAIYVDVDANGSKDGTSWPNAFTDLQDGLEKAFDADQIWVTEGTYKPTDTNDRSISLEPREGVSLYGGFEGNETDPSQRDPNVNNHRSILSGDIGTPNDTGDNSYHVVMIVGEYGSTVSIDRFTVTDGNACVGSDREAYGGGMFNLDCFVALKDCTFADNSARLGGGAILSRGSSATFTGSTLADNTAYKGGGIAVYYGLASGMSFSNCNLEDNATHAVEGFYYPSGAGFWTNLVPVLTVTDCTFSGNSSVAYSGAIHGDFALDTTITGCTFTDNHAEYSIYSGGAAYLKGEAATVSGCTFEGNSEYGVYLLYSESEVNDCSFTGNDQCGLLVDRLDGTVENCTFSDNNGVGIVCRYIYSSYDLNIRNCLFHNNVNTSGTTYDGGGISNYQSYSHISNCTIADNHAIYGGGICNKGVEFWGAKSHPTVTNCILWGNEADQAGDEVYNDSLSDANFSYCDIKGSGGSSNWDPNLGNDDGGNIDEDPCFVNADANDFHLSAESPCINTGDANGDYTGQEDIDGQPRVMAGRVDMGVDEFSGIFNLDQEEWYDSIQEAIDDANDSANETIEVGPGTYYETIDFDGNAVRVRSVDPNDWELVAATIIDADGSGTIVLFESGEDCNSILAGLTVTDGDAVFGGGIFCDTSSPTIRNCVIRGNYAIWGGGMGVDSASPTVTNCVFTGNTTRWDGAGMCTDDASVTVTNCLFVDNATLSGQTGAGGGMANFTCSPTVVNCTFNANFADSDGGGIFNYGASSTPLLENCIFWGDETDGSGDEVYNYNSADPNFRHCDIEGCGGSGGWNPSLGTDGGGNIDSDPNFIDPNDPDGSDDIWVTGDDGLCLTSTRCIDAADGNVAPETDILGQSRMDDPNWSNIGIGDPNYVDMGAYEHDPNS